MQRVPPFGKAPVKAGMASARHGGLGGHVCSARARRARHPNQCSGHLSQCFTPKHTSLLQPRLPHPCGLGGPRVGGMATSPLPSRGSPTRGQKMGKRGANRGKIRGNFAWRARRANVLSLVVCSPESILQTCQRPALFLKSCRPFDHRDGSTKHPLTTTCRRSSPNRRRLTSNCR